MRVTGQLVKSLVNLTSLSVELVTYGKKWGKKTESESLARQRRCLQDFFVIFLRVLVCLE